MSMDQKPTPAQNETNKTKIDDPQTLKHETSSENSPPSQTNKPEYDDSNPISDPNAKNIPQAETQPSSENSPFQTNIPETDDPKTSKHDAESVSSAKNIPQAETQASSESSPPSQTNKPETDDSKTLKHDPESGSNAKNIPQAETQTGSRNAPSSQTNKTETDDSKALKHDPESGPSAKNVPQTETQTGSKNSLASETKKPETDEPKALKHDPESEPSAESIPKGETPTSSKHSPPPKDVLSQTTPIAKDSAIDAYPQVQPAKDESTSKHSSPPVEEILPAGDDITPKESSLPKNGSTRMADPETRAGETLEQSSVTPGHKKRSNWQKLRSALQISKKSKANSSQDMKVVTTSEPKPSTSSQEPRPDDWQISLIQADISYIRQRAKELEHYNNQLSKVLDEASEDFDRLRQGKKKTENLQELRKDMMKLKLQDPSKYKSDADEKNPFKKLKFRSKASQSISEEVLKKIPQLHKREAFETSMDFKDFEARYNQLSPCLKLCLLCFSVFPENAIIRKRLMVQWWVIEGFASEDDAKKYFNQLIEKGFIEPVNENKSPSVRSCRMHPFYRSALVMLAQRVRFFNFNDKGDPTQKFSDTFQSCLMGEGLLSLQDLKELMSLAEGKEDKLPTQKLPETSQSSGERLVLKELSSSGEHKENKLSTQSFSGASGEPTVFKELRSSGERKENKLPVAVDHLEKLHLLINVDEQILDFKPDWFKRMKNLSFLYLGRWKVLATDHIEVEDTEFLDGLEFMGFVKFLSLQGISNIIALPSSILKLANLNILDLRACYNLETIPEKIDFLKNLQHLDMSECYLVEHMPKSLSSLKKLKVIKGFVVGNEGKKIQCCTLDDLVNLPDLIKLCIYTGLVKFPEKRHVRALQHLEALEKLTITWGGSALQATSDNQPGNGNQKENNHPNNGNEKNSDKAQGRLPLKLEKLDLKCFPKLATPYWLELENLEHLNLKKLYIRGGKLSDLGQYQDTADCNLVEPVKKKTWKVEVLRLKYLSEIKMEWRQLLELFPDLEYLEQVSCPKLTLFPSDANGVWINKIKTKGN